MEKTDPGYNWLDIPFSKGGFKNLTASEPRREKPVPKEPENTEQPTSMEAFSCPNEGCVRVFQRFSSLERHLSFERCSKSLERQSLLDLAKTEYASLLEEGVGRIPTLKSREPLESDETVSDVGEGWALKETKKSYRFNDAQKAYLEAKFDIGQTTGKKMDGETVAREMRKSIGPDGNRLFRVSEFLTPQQVSSFFSRLAAKFRHNVVLDDDLRASQEETNFDAARQDILSHLDLKHPIIYDQYDICALVRKRTLKNLKLGLLQSLCDCFELETPAKRVRSKAPYISLLEEMVSCCSCSS